MATRSVPRVGRGRTDDDSDEDDEETRRVEYLRRHRVMLEQKRRLETERRVVELESDQASIAARQRSFNDWKERTAGAALGSSSSLPSPARSSAQSATPVGTYARFDELSVETLRIVAEKETLGDMVPLNTRGKYHTRYMKDAYPIAGTQLKLERERGVILAAKKRLVLTKVLGQKDPADQVQAQVACHVSGTFEHLAYRKLNFLSDNFTSVLRNEQVHVDVAAEQRRVRVQMIQHREGLDQFWTRMHHRRYHETLSWLKTHRFRDVDVPVVIKMPPGNANEFAVELNRDVGVTPLMAACRLHHVELVQAILEQGSATYLATANGDTALHFLFHEWPEPQLTSVRNATELLARADHTLRILKLLVERDADVSQQNAFGECPIQYAARLGLVECVELLLSCGGDAFAQDRTGASAVSLAKANRHHDIVKILQTHDIVERTAAKERARRDCIDKINHSRGRLTADWSEPPEKLLARLAVEERRAGHLRNQFIDQTGNVIVCSDDE